MRPGFAKQPFLATASPTSFTSRSPLSSPASVVLVKTLIERKRSRRFADDNLLIGDYKLKNVNGELRLWAEARQTPTPKGQ